MHSMHSLPALLGEGAGMLQIRQCGLNLSPRSMLSSNRVAAISSCNHAQTMITRSLLKERGGGAGGGGGGGGEGEGGMFGRRVGDMGRETLVT